METVIRERLEKLKIKLEKGLPLLLIDTTILTSILNIEGYTGVNIVNMLKNSTLASGENSFRNSIYYDKVIGIIDAKLNKEKRVLYTDSVNKTVAFASPITISVPNKSNTKRLEMQTIPYIDMIVTSDDRIYTKLQNLLSKNIAESDITPLECIFVPEVKDEDKLQFVNNLFALETRSICREYATTDDFLAMFDESDGFIINYDYGKYLIVGEKNSEHSIDGKDTMLYIIDGEDIYETDASAIEMIFY